MKLKVGETVKLILPNESIGTIWWKINGDEVVIKSMSDTKIYFSHPKIFGEIAIPLENCEKVEEKRNV